MYLQKAISSNIFSIKMTIAESRSTSGSISQRRESGSGFGSGSATLLLKND
jgi:hypothetical protein